MLHDSGINPFDSHEARAHRDDPEIVAMTDLVRAFHEDDVRRFERILGRDGGRLLDDELVREHVGDLRRTLRAQVVLRSVGPYARVRLSRISRDLDGVPVEEVEGLLAALILDGRLEGRIDQVRGILVREGAASGGGSGDKWGREPAEGPVPEDRTGETGDIAALNQLTAALEHVTAAISQVGGKGASSFHQQVLQ